MDTVVTARVMTATSDSLDVREDVNIKIKSAVSISCRNELNYELL